MRSNTKPEAKKHPDEILLATDSEENLFDWLEVDSIALEKSDSQVQLAEKLLKLFASFSEGINKFSEDDFRLGTSFSLGTQTQHPLVTKTRCLLESTSSLLILQSTEIALDVIFLDRRCEKDFLINAQNYQACHRFDIEPSKDSFSLDGETTPLSQLSFCAQKIFIEFIENARQLFQLNKESFQIFETEEDTLEPAQKEPPPSRPARETIDTNLGLSSLLRFEMSDAQITVPSATASPQKTNSPKLTKEELHFMKVEDMTISAACEMLRESIRREAETIKRSGVRAFELQDLDEAESAISRGRKLKSFQSLIETALDDWKD